MDRKVTTGDTSIVTATAFREKEATSDQRTRGCADQR